MATESFADKPSLKITASRLCLTEDLTHKSHKTSTCGLDITLSRYLSMENRDIFNAVLKLKLQSIPTG
jgi:hypothetical protein